MSTILLTTDHEQLARYAKALGHPVRVYIIELLSKQSCCFSGDIAEDLPIARSTLSQHLKELKSAGLIQGTIEYPKIRYCINRENWERARELFGKLLDSGAFTKDTCITEPSVHLHD
jgi:ArsR family transcriptional regulator, arsenate/arsenite/antimonite-responsive transcriptional repressor